MLRFMHLFLNKNDYESETTGEASSPIDVKQISEATSMLSTKP